MIQLPSSKLFKSFPIATKAVATIETSRLARKMHRHNLDFFGQTAIDRNGRTTFTYVLVITCSFQPEIYLSWSTSNSND